MNKATALFCSSLFFLLGVILGLTGRESLQPVSAQAENMHASAVDQAYRQLAGNQSPFTDGSQRLSQIAAVTTPSVVHIQSERRSKNGGIVEETGSGVIMTSPQAKTAFIVTNRHVIADADVHDIRIRLHDGRIITPLDARGDSKSDVAVLLIDEPNVQPGRWGDSDTVNIGHMVLAQ